MKCKSIAYVAAGLIHGVTRISLLYLTAEKAHRQSWTGFLKRWRRK
jgi:hypothetical protein